MRNLTAYEELCVKHDTFKQMEEIMKKDGMNESALLLRQQMYSTSAQPAEEVEPIAVQPTQSRSPGREHGRLKRKRKHHSPE